MARVIKVFKEITGSVSSLNTRIPQAPRTPLTVISVFLASENKNTEKQAALPLHCVSLSFVGHKSIARGHLTVLRNIKSSVPHAPNNRFALLNVESMSGMQP